MSPVTCDVWMLCLDDIDGDTISRHLDASDHGRLRRLRHPDDRLRHAGGRSLLRAAVAERTGTAPSKVALTRLCATCGSDQHGKPHVRGHAEHVSVTHSGSVVLVAITDVGPVGVDVERCDPDTDVDRVAAYIVGAGERPPRGTAGFYRTWCRKEAVVKATGDGLSIPLDQVRVTQPDEDADVLSFPRRDVSITLCDINLTGSHPGYTAALAVLAPHTISVHLRDGTALIHQIGDDR